MTQPNWEEVEVPRGAYIGWGNQSGQHVTGKVLAYADTGGTNFAGDPCPQVQVELTEPAASFNKEGQRTDFPAGELVVLNAGQANLSRAVRAAALNTGDLVKITLADFEKTANGTVKIYDIKVARGAGGTVTQQAPVERAVPGAQATPLAPQQAPQQSGGGFDAAPPF